MPSPTPHERLQELFQNLLDLHAVEDLDVETFSRLLEERQGIIDEIQEIDGSLALIRQEVGRSPKLRRMLDEIADLDARLLEKAEVVKEGLHAALSKTGNGLRAARGYRVQVARGAALIDRAL